jgi:putative transposase
MIRSTKCTLKYSNTNKLDKLHLIISEYRNVIGMAIDILWEYDDKIPMFMPKEITSQLASQSWLSARAIQCAGKQASGIVRGCKKKQSKRLYMINKLISDGRHKQARKLQAIYNKTKISKPDPNNVEPELDSRFIKINIDNNETSFDGWVMLSSIGNKVKLNIPFKGHKHFNRLINNGFSIKKGIRLSKKNITFMFEKDVPQVEDGTTLGIDIGQKTTLSCSNGQMIDVDNHGHNYQSICKKLSRKKKGSNSFKRTEKQRSNYIGWCINQLNLTNVSFVNRENIKYLRKYRRVSRSLSHWNYGELFEKLDQKLVENCVQINKLSPTYTSQRCSQCGWVRKRNRKGKQFKCDKCNFCMDSDLNASMNLSLYLKPIGKKERLLHKNRIGFYWNVAGQELIVSDTQKINFVNKKSQNC